MTFGSGIFCLRERLGISRDYRWSSVTARGIFRIINTVSGHYPNSARGTRPLAAHFCWKRRFLIETQISIRRVGEVTEERNPPSRLMLHG